jgi:hypothetical protein
LIANLVRYSNHVNSFYNYLCFDWYLKKIPIKEQELILIAENSQQGYDDLVKLLHETIKSKFLIDIFDCKNLEL